MWREPKFRKPGAPPRAAPIHCWSNGRVTSRTYKPVGAWCVRMEEVSYPQVEWCNPIPTESAPLEAALLEAAATAEWTLCFCFCAFRLYCAANRKLHYVWPGRWWSIGLNWKSGKRGCDYYKGNNDHCWQKSDIEKKHSFVFHHISQHLLLPLTDAVLTMLIRNIALSLLPLSYCYFLTVLLCQFEFLPKGINRDTSYLIVS